MAKPLNDSVLIKTLSSSKTPLTADEIANKVGSMRHKVNPFLRKMVTTGLISELPGTAESPVRFAYRQTAESDSTNGKVVPLTAGRRSDEAPKPAAKAKAKTEPGKDSSKKISTEIGNQPVSETLKSSEKAVQPKDAAISRKSTATLKAKPAAQPKMAAESKSEVKAKQQIVKEPPSASQVTSKATASISTASAAGKTAGDSARDQVLRLLAQGPAKREDILMELGPIVLVLDEMFSNGEVIKDFIIDDHVFELTDQGYLSFAQLPTQPDNAEDFAAQSSELITEDVSSGSIDSAPEIHSEQSDTAEMPLLTTKAPEVMDGAPSVVSHQAESEAQASLVLTQEVKADDSVPDRASGGIAHQDTSDLPENPIMAEMAKLMEQLVNERVGQLAHKIEQGERDHATLVKVGASIKKATSALQIALDALNEIGDSFS